MYEYQQLKTSYESSLQKLKKVQEKVYLATFIILVGSMVISQILLRAYKDPSLFMVSSFWMLIAGLPMFGFLLKKGKALDHQLYETILQGLDLEGSKNLESYFAEKANFFKKNRQFITRSIPMWSLNILTRISHTALGKSSHLFHHLGREGSLGKVYKPSLRLLLVYLAKQSAPLCCSECEKYGLIIAWSRVMLKTSGIDGSEYIKTMAFIGCSFGFLALYVYFFSSGPYRKFQNAVKKYAFLD